MNGGGYLLLNQGLYSTRPFVAVYLRRNNHVRHFLFSGGWGPGRVEYILLLWCSIRTSSSPDISKRFRLQSVLGQLSFPGLAVYVTALTDTDRTISTVQRRMRYDSQQDLHDLVMMRFRELF